MLQDYLIKIWNTGKFPYATLIAGHNFSCSKSLLCNFIDGISRLNHNLASENNPDVYFVEKDTTQKSIAIEQIRQLSNWLNQSPMISKNKFAIICNAECMTFNAFNACLKILEEPGENTHLFLTTNAPNSLPKTLLSRCWLLYNTQKNTPTLYLDLIQILLKNDPEELQKLLSHDEIQSSMKTLLVQWVKSKAIENIILQNLEIELFDKIKTTNLEEAIKTADQINEFLHFHLSLSFDARHIAILVLSELFLIND